ncbi:MAG TPA: gluconokinase, partial [Burkholderiales bacterium]|nr:gluconokinase [Burkholderiales bacterium]
DRSPWLHAIAVWIDTVRAAGRHGIVACSALKRTYRKILIDDRRDVQLVYLSGSFKLIAHRMAMRHEHFMPLALLQSQFDTLEPPGPDEHPLTVSIDASPQEIAAMIVAGLRLQGTEQQVT